MAAVLFCESRPKAVFRSGGRYSVGRRRDFRCLAGFLATTVLGTAAHFLYAWSGGSPLVGALCPVNESVWEHMKLLFFPAMGCTVIQLAVERVQGGAVPAARALGVTAGLAAIPALYYTYSGILGFHVLGVDIAIFYLSAALTFRLDARLRGRRRLWGGKQQAAGVLWLWGLAFLFVLWTFRPPHIGLFLDPVSGGYGIP